MNKQAWPIQKLVLYSMVFIFLFSACSPFDKEFSCKSRLYLTVVNQTVDTIMVTVVDSTKEWYSSKAETQIYIDSFAIMPQNSITDSIGFQWRQGSSCSYYPEKSSAYAIEITCQNNRGVVEKRIVFPYDTTKSYISLCEDCLNLSYDTIVIK